MKKKYKSKSEKTVSSGRKTGPSRGKKQELNIVKSAPATAHPKKAESKANGAGIKKQYLKSDDSCNITFRLPKEAATGARVVAIAGDFNNWNVADTEMTKLKNGDFKLTLKLPRNREYRFRYLIDNTRWENDWHADRYVPNSFGSDDSLVIV